MLAAFVCWAELNIKAVDADKERRMAAICSCIRFPAIPAGVLLDYFRHYKCLRWFDPDKDLLLRAVSELRNAALLLAQLG